MREIDRRVVWRVACAVAVLVCCHPASSFAQMTERRIELAPGLSIIRFKDSDAYQESLRRQFPSDVQLSSWADPGPSLRLTFNLSPTVAVESTAALFGRFAGEGGFPSKGGAKLLWDGGVAYRWPTRHVSLLAIGRAGAISYELATQIVSGSAASPVVVETGTGRTYASAFAGGGAQVFLFSRCSLRAEVGDFIVWYRPEPKELNPSFSRHNLRMDVGLSFAFGRQLQ